MRCMLDTNICIDIIRGRNPSALQHLLSLSPRDVCLSVITLSELEFGIAKSAAPERNHLALLEFLAPIAVKPFTDAAAVVYGRIRAGLESKGLGIGSMDTLIAAHAMSSKLTLVTNNAREFSRVPGLKVVSWNS